VAQEGQRRSIFLRYLKEVAAAVSTINGDDRDKLYEQLLAVAKKKTAEADVKLDDRGKPIVDEEELELGDNCIIVSQQAASLPAVAADAAVDEAGDEKPARGRKKKPVVEKQTVEKPAAPKKTPEKPPKKPAKRRK
jgi:DNA topoisomerase-6 subunit B